MTDLGLISEEGHNNQTSTIMAIILPTQGEPLIKSSCRVAIMSGEREITYSDLLRYANLYAKYIPTEKGTKTIILGENREGWFFALYAVWRNEGVVIPVDAAATPDDVAYIINDAEPKCIWTTSARKDLVAEALNLVGKDIRVNIIDDYENADVSKEKEADIRLRLEDLALICYTSGTTGSPKGVMLTYENIMVNVRAVSSEVEIYNSERRTLVLLPLHHVLPLVGTVVMPMIIGGGVAICPSLSAADIMTTLKRGEIGLMIGVPRLWQTLYRGIKAKIDASPVTRGLFNICRKADNRTLSRTIFKSVHKKLGGHITYLVSGGAALDNETAIGLKTLGLDVLEGYGMTEAAPMIAFTRPDDIVPGSVGLPIHGCEVIVINGELCARGKNVMSGYYKREKETADIIDKNGWLHTGDLGRIDEKGRIFITGRMKEIIVLSNGKNVNPTEIEHKIEEYADIVKEAAVTEDGDLLKVIIVPQSVWAMDKTIAEMEECIKRDVLAPYNLTVAPYKKLMSLLVYQGDLPRTRMEKLQRYKLKELIRDAATADNDVEKKDDDSNNMFPEYMILKDYISAEKHCEVHPTSNLETDLAMDSLDKVTLQGFIEQTFGITLASEQITAFANVGEMAQFIAEYKTRMDVEDIDWHKIIAQSSSHLRLPKMSVAGLRMLRMFRSFAKKRFLLETRGMENIPASGPYILAPNHQSVLDGPLIVSAFSDKMLRDIYFYAKKDHVQGTFMRWLARNNNIIIMDMSTLKDSIQMLGEVLKQGRNIAIFPEGTRTRNGKIGEFKKTFVILSKELSVPIVPVRIDGAYQAMPRGKYLPKKHKVLVTYLPAVTPQESDTYESLAEKVRTAVVNA